MSGTKDITPNVLAIEESAVDRRKCLSRERYMRYYLEHLGKARKGLPDR